MTPRIPVTPLTPCSKPPSMSALFIGLVAFVSPVALQAKGGGIIHLTGFFNREYDPDLEQGEHAV